MLNRSGRRLALLTAVLTCGLACCPTAWGGPRQSDTLLSAGDPAPNFRLRSLDGEHDTELAGLDRTAVLFFGSYS